MHLQESRQYQFHGAWLVTPSGRLRLLRRGGQYGQWFWAD